MKINTIVKTVGSLDLLLGVVLINILIFSVETIAPWVSSETLLFVRWFADVVAAINIVIDLLLIISSSVRDYESANKVLPSELLLISCLLIVAVFNTLNGGVFVDACLVHRFYWLKIHFCGLMDY